MGIRSNHRIFALIVGFCLLSMGFGLSAAPAGTQVLADLRAQLSKPEAQIDLVEAKLTIDRIIDPTIDVSATLEQLDLLATRIKARFPPGASNRAKLDLLLSSLYEPGPWNEQRPFSYDLEDPLGKNIQNKMLSTYLSTRKGQCVSMPILFTILGQKLGLPVTLATAPNHLLVKYGDEDTGQWLNVEATSGGIAYDSQYERDTHISQQAIENQIYLRPLSQRESVTVMMYTLMAFYNQRRQPERMLAAADLVLEVDPTSVVAMQGKGAAYYWLLEQRYKSKYPLASQIPPGQQDDYLYLSRQNLMWYEKAEALGWRAWTPAQQDQYLQAIERERTVRQGDRWR